jgi:16S rRNA (cytosine1402-N4)-methyltransferase
MTGDEDVAAPGGHTPVLLNEVIEVLRPHDGGIYVDGTFGAGGYTTAILESAACRVWAIDRDPAAVAQGAALAARFSGRLAVIEGCFGQMDRLLSDEGLSLVNGIALDLGVSSPQLDAPERGFSFRFDGPLDMRMAGTGSDGGPSAADVVNGATEAELAELIYRYGEERRSRQVARAIVAARREKPIERTLELAEIVRRVVRRAADGRDPATRTFQALRIYVNDELGELERGLEAAERLLSPDGRLAVVAFHSLEDRIAKDFLATRSGQGSGVSRHRPAMEQPVPSFERLFKRAKRPEAAECATNPRARSARLRAARRTAAPAWDSRSERGVA